MKIFLYSESYFEDILLYCFDSLFKLNVEELILLNESHSDIDNSKRNYKIILADNYKHAVDSSDLVLIIGGIEDLFLLNKICHYSKLQNKRLVKKIYKSTSNVFKYKNELAQIPVILLLYFGRVSQQERIELVLSNYFKNKSVAIYQHFSSRLSCIIRNDSDCIVDEYIKESLSIEKKEVGVVCANGEIFVDSKKRQSSMLKYLLDIKPNIVLLCTESNDYYVKIDEIKQILYVIMQKKEGGVIRSNYFSFFQNNNSRIEYYDIYSKFKNEIINTKELCCEDFTPEKIDNLLYQITLPDGVKYIN